MNDAMNDAALPDILIVDDDPGMVQVLAKALRPLGRLRFAMHGQDALERIASAVPDIVLLDAQMPGLSGFDVLDAIKANPALVDLPVIMVTGHGSVEDVLNSMQVQRRISLHVPHFSVLPKVLPGTELLAVLPAQIARLFTLEGGLKQLELPFPVGEFEVSLHWHPNSDSSAALRWFCQTVAGAIIDYTVAGVRRPARAPSRRRSALTKA